jgi:hypothetical protein
VPVRCCRDKTAEEADMEKEVEELRAADIVSPVSHLQCACACCCRDKTSEEADMEKEVEELRVRLEGLKELTPGETDTINELAGELDEKEKALYRLQVRALAAWAAAVCALFSAVVEDGCFHVVSVVWSAC